MELATTKQIQKLVILMQMHLIDDVAFKKKFKIKSRKELTKVQISSIIDYYERTPIL